MAKFQKKVVQIEAYQLGDKNAPEWFTKALIDGKISAPVFSNYVVIPTQKGSIRGYRGDYLILADDNTAIYLCKKPLFEATYEPYVDYGDSDMVFRCDGVPDISTVSTEMTEENK